MKAWTRVLEPGPVLMAIWLVLALSVQVNAAPTLPDQNDEQSTEIEYYPVADATGCYYNFQHYDEGDRIITNEPCLNCTCHNQMLMCYLRVCPFTKAIGANCKVESKPDQCCPVITCPEVPVHLITSTVPSTAVGHPNEYGCTIDNLFYSDGARVPSNPDNPCELCYCIRNKTACVMQECTLNVDGCKPVFQEGVCCPVRYNCEHPEYLEGPTTPQITTTTTTTTTLAPTTTLQPFECIFNGQTYSDGELVKKDIPCEKCYCMRGDILCAVQECGPTPLDKVNCTALPVRKGQCCPDTYDCTGITEEELTTLSSTTGETEPTTITSVAEGEEKGAATERLLTTPETEILVTSKSPEESTHISSESPEVTTLPSTAEGQHRDEEEEQTVTPEIIEQVTSKPVELPQPAEQETEKPLQQTTAVEIETAVEVTTEGSQETEGPAIEQVTRVAVEPESTEKEPVAVVTAVTPSEAEEEKVSKEQERIEGTTEIPVESFTSRVTEAIETITTRVSEAVEAITSIVSRIGTDKPETGEATERAEDVEKATTVTPEEEITKVTVEENVTLSSAEAEVEKTSGIPSESHKEAPEVTEESYEKEGPTPTVASKVPEKGNEVEPTEGSGEPPQTEEYEETTTQVYKEEVQSSITELPEEPSVKLTEGPVEEKITTPEPETQPEEETKLTTKSQYIPSESPVSETTEVHLPEFTKSPEDMSKEPEITPSENLTTEEIITEPERVEATEPSVVKESEPTETVSGSSSISPIIEEGGVKEGEPLPEQSSETPSEKTTEEVAQTEQPHVTSVPEEQTSEIVKAPETTVPSETTTEKEEIIIVTEIPTRKTDLPESMDHVSETALSTETPKSESEGTPEPETYTEPGKEQEQEPTQASVEEEKGTETTRTVPEISTDISLEAELTTKISEIQRETEIPTEQTTGEPIKIEPSTELPREKDNEIIPEEPDLKVQPPSDQVTEEVAPTITEVTPSAEEVTTPRKTEEIITEKAIIPEVCTSETECAPGAVPPKPSISETETTTEPEVQETVKPEGTTESNKIPDLEEVTKESNEIPEGETEGISHIATEYPSTVKPISEGKETEVPIIEEEEGSGATEPTAKVTEPTPGIKIIEQEEATTESQKEFTKKSEQTESATEEQKLPEEPITEQVSTVPEVVPTERTDITQQTEVPEREIPGEGSCLVDGKTYSNNSSVPPINHCQTSCRCVSSILRCESIECLPAPDGMQNCIPVFSTPESCCPTYSCTGPEITSPMESDSHVVGTTTPIAEVQSTEIYVQPEGTETPTLTSVSESVVTEEGRTEVQPEATVTPIKSEESTEQEIRSTDIPHIDVSHTTPSEISVTETEVEIATEGAKVTKPEEELPLETTQIPEIQKEISTESIEQPTGTTKTSPSEVSVTEIEQEAGTEEPKVTKPEEGLTPKSTETTEIPEEIATKETVEQLGGALKTTISEPSATEVVQEIRTEIPKITKPEEELVPETTKAEEIQPELTTPEPVQEHTYISEYSTSQISSTEAAQEIGTEGHKLTEPEEIIPEGTQEPVLTTAEPILETSTSQVSSTVAGQEIETEEPKLTKPEVKPGKPGVTQTPEIQAEITTAAPIQIHTDISETSTSQIYSTEAEEGVGTEKSKETTPEEKLEPEITEIPSVEERITTVGPVEEVKPIEGTTEQDKEYAEVEQPTATESGVDQTVTPTGEEVVKAETQVPDISKPVQTEQPEQVTTQVPEEVTLPETGATDIPILVSKIKEEEEKPKIPQITTTEETEIIASTEYPLFAETEKSTEEEELVTQEILPDQPVTVELVTETPKEGRPTSPVSTVSEKEKEPELGAEVVTTEPSPYELEKETERSTDIPIIGEVTEITEQPKEGQPIKPVGELPKKEQPSVTPEEPKQETTTIVSEEAVTVEEEIQPEIETEPTLQTVRTDIDIKEGEPIYTVTESSKKEQPYEEITTTGSKLEEPITVPEIGQVLTETTEVQVETTERVEVETPYAPTSQEPETAQASETTKQPEIYVTKSEEQPEVTEILIEKQTISPVAQTKEPEDVYQASTTLKSIIEESTPGEKEGEPEQPPVELTEPSIEVEGTTISIEEIEKTPASEVTEKVEVYTTVKQPKEKAELTTEKDLIEQSVTEPEEEEKTDSRISEIPEITLKPEIQESEAPSKDIEGLTTTSPISEAPVTELEKGLIPTDIEQTEKPTETPAKTESPIVFEEPTIVTQVPHEAETETFLPPKGDEEELPQTTSLPVKEPVEHITEIPEAESEKPIESDSHVTESLPSEEITKAVPAEPVTTESVSQLTQKLPTQEITEAPAEIVTTEPAEPVTTESVSQLTHKLPTQEITEPPAEIVTTEPTRHIVTPEQGTEITKSTEEETTAPEEVTNPEVTVTESELKTSSEVPVEEEITERISVTTTQTELVPSTELHEPGTERVTEKTPSTERSASPEESITEVATEKETELPILEQKVTEPVTSEIDKTSEEPLITIRTGVDTTESGITEQEPSERTTEKQYVTEKTPETSEESEEITEQPVTGGKVTEPVLLTEKETTDDGKHPAVSEPEHVPTEAYTLVPSEESKTAATETILPIVSTVTEESKEPDGVAQTAATETILPIVPTATEESKEPGGVAQTEQASPEPETKKPTYEPEEISTIAPEEPTKQPDEELTKAIVKKVDETQSTSLPQEVTEAPRVTTQPAEKPYGEGETESPTLTTVSAEQPNASEPIETDLYTSGPVEASTRRHIPGELSTSAPLSTDRPTEQTVVTESARPTIPGEKGGDEDYEPGEDEEEEDQSAFGPGTCRYGGKVYVSAQQIPRDDPCDFCFCFRSDIICLQQSCPPPIPRCHEEPIRGFCCPRYECPVSMATAVNVTTSTTTTTTTLPPHFFSHAYKGRATKTGCQIQGKAYQVGEVIKATSGPCLHCTCGGDGQMKCDPKPCSPEPMLRQMIAAAASRRRR